MTLEQILSNFCVCVCGGGGGGGGAGRGRGRGMVEGGNTVFFLYEVVLLHG